MPISPNEVAAAKVALTPEWVFTVWDKLIAENWNGHKSVILQKDASRALSIAGVVPHINPRIVGWMDIEDAYRAVGWKVVYDTPGYNEDYDASFTFTKA